MGSVLRRDVLAESRPPFAIARESHKQRLLEGALECLREKGYASTTARDIAAAAGANIGSIGYHYGSVDALLSQALVEGFRRWTERISSRVRSFDANSAAERLRVSWETMLDDFEGQEGLLQAFLEALAPASRSPELRSELAGFYRETREDVAAVVKESVGGQPGAQADATVIATLLLALFDGLQLQWLLEPETVPRADAVERALGTALLSLTQSENE